MVLDSIGQLWIVDSGIPYNATPGSDALYGGSKIMSFNQTTSELIRTYTIPQDLLVHGTNANDVRINNTLGSGGYAFIVRRALFANLLLNFEADMNSFNVVAC